MSNTVPDSVSQSLNVHATAVALGDHACLLRGPSGAGKSDLALRFLFGTLFGKGSAGAAGARSLVADDRVILTRRLSGRSSGRLAGGTAEIFVSCPRPIQGLLEVRGVGLMSGMAIRASAKLCLIVDLVAPDAVPRLPDTEVEPVLGVDVERCSLAPFEASAPIKLALAMSQAVGRSLSRSG
jgi:HPr kinase/phosphorylase